MDPEQEAAVGEVQGADDVAADRGLLVVLAPIDVWSAGAAGAVEDVGWAHALKHVQHPFTVLHADRCRRDRPALAFQELVQMPGDPAIAAPDQKGARCRLDLLNGGALGIAVSRIDFVFRHPVQP